MRTKPTETMTRAEAYRLRAETVENLRKLERINRDARLPFCRRYEAAVIIDTAREAIADFDEVLRILPEV